MRQKKNQKKIISLRQKIKYDLLSDQIGSAFVSDKKTEPGQNDPKAKDPNNNDAGDDMALARTFIGLWVTQNHLTGIDENAILMDKMIDRNEAKTLGISTVLYDLILMKMNTKGAPDEEITAGDIKLFNDTIKKYKLAFGLNDENDAIKLYNTAVGFEMADLDAVINAGDKIVGGKIGDHPITKDTTFKDLQAYLTQEAYDALTQRFHGQTTVVDLESVGRFLASLPLISKLGTTVQEQTFQITVKLPKFEGDISEGSILKYITKEAKKDDPDGDKVTEPSKVQKLKDDLAKDENSDINKQIEIREQIKAEDPADYKYINLAELAKLYATKTDLVKSAENFYLSCQENHPENTEALETVLSQWMENKAKKINNTDYDLSKLSGIKAYMSEQDLKAKCVDYLLHLPSGKYTDKSKLIMQLKGEDGKITDPQHHEQPKPPATVESLEKDIGKAFNGYNPIKAKYSDLAAQSKAFNEQRAKITGLINQIISFKDNDSSKVTGLHQWLKAQINGLITDDANNNLSNWLKDMKNKNWADIKGLSQIMNS